VLHNIQVYSEKIREEGEKEVSADAHISGDPRSAPSYIFGT